MFAVAFWGAIVFPDGLAGGMAEGTNIVTAFTPGIMGEVAAAIGIAIFGAVILIAIFAALGGRHG